MKKPVFKKIVTFLLVIFAGSFFALEMLAGTPIERNKNSDGEYLISAPPEELNLDPFYKKYAKVNGIHIMSSNRVPDSAFVVACAIVDFMTGGLPEPVLNQMVKLKTRVGIMARYEGTTDIPEHAYLVNDTMLNWDVRARGLGGTVHLPLTTCAEENLLCYQIDKYYAEDILIHEFSHTIHGVGIMPIDSAFNGLLQEKLDAAIAQGKYKNTYAATNIWEYWAEGVQNWFNVNAEVKQPDGKHNWVNTREDMKKYDPDLYEIVSRYFPDSETSPSCHGAANLYIE
ncbi:hypothetical protein [Maribellus comscasis]|uniref:hypothetical protein n=1 Tax=Maribellus comscasis TaxID=2681766 RepID=UPI001FE538AB|nr:hypothetical protein [Maribellus comscasis]